MALCAESAILGKGRRYLGGLEQHSPYVLVCRVKQLSQHLVLSRVELLHIECPSLTREDPAKEHDLDHVDKLDFLVYHVLDAFLESGQLHRSAPGQALLFPGSEPRGDSGSKFGGRHPVGVARLGDVEPPRLPPLYGLHIGDFEPGDVRHFAHHGESTLCLLVDHHLRFDIEGLQPQAKVGPDAEEGLAHDDKRRDVEDENPARSRT